MDDNEVLIVRKIKGGRYTTEIAARETTVNDIFELLVVLLKSATSLVEIVAAAAGKTEEEVMQVAERVATEASKETNADVYFGPSNPSTTVN